MPHSDATTPSTAVRVEHEVAASRPPASGRAGRARRRRRPAAGAARGAAVAPRARAGAERGGRAHGDAPGRRRGRSPAQGAHAAGEVVARARRRTRTSRTTRTPATAARRRPGRAMAAAACHGLGHRRRRRHRHQARRRRRPPRRPPRRWPPPPAGRRPRRRSTDRSRPLLRPPAISTAGVEARHGGQHRTGRGRLGVVVEPHPVASPTSSTRWGSPRNAEQRPAASLGVAPPPAAVASGAQGVDQVVGHAPGELVHLGHRSPVRARPGPRPPAGSRRAPSPKVRTVAPRARGSGRRGAHHGVVGVGHGHVAGPAVGPQPGLGGAVVVDGGVPVEVVGGEVEPAPTAGRNASVRASWNDDTSATTTSASPPTASSSGSADVAGRHGPAPRGLEHGRTRVVTVVLPLVPVTATIGHRARRHASSTSPTTGTPASQREHRVAGGHAGLTTISSTRARQGAERRRRRAPRPARRRARPRRAAAARPASSSTATTSCPSASSRAAVARAAHAEAVDEDATGRQRPSQCSPVTDRKSA